MESLTQPESQTKSLFGNPIIKKKFDDIQKLNEGLMHLIYEGRASDEGVKVSNNGGWQSKTALLESNETYVKELKDKILQAHRELLLSLNPNEKESNLTGWQIEAWANVNVKGHSNASHDHTKEHNLWSGIYYVNNGGDNENIAGETVFEDRHYTSNGFTVNRTPSPIVDGKAQKNEYKIKPKTGMMVLFPGTLYHRVEPYNGDNERITIAFNLRHPNFAYYDFDADKGSGKAVKWLWYNFRGGMRLINYFRKKIK